MLGGPLPGITGFLSSPRLEGVAASLSAASVPGVGGVAPALCLTRGLVGPVSYRDRPVAAVGRV